VSDFKPPKPNQAVIWLSEFLLPFYLNFVERVSFRFFEGPDRPLDFLRGKPTVIVLNHSDRQDPLLLVALAKYMREPFYCVVARETFDWYFGFLGWLFQRLGCFSVDRGTADFRSINMIKKVLTETTRKFLVFPEGEITGDDRYVHEISTALIHIFIKAQNEIADGDEQKSIWILPAGVSYRLETDLHSAIDKTLRTIERRLSIKSDGGPDIEHRVHVAVGTVLRRLAQHYKFVLSEHDPPHEQVRLLARHICDRINEYKVSVSEESPTEQVSTDQLLYKLRSDISDELESARINTDYGNELQRNTLKTYSEFMRDLDRVERLSIVERILKQKTSPIQICRVTDFLEAETTGRMTAKGRQTASIYFGEPIDVLPYVRAYKADKDEAITQLRDHVQHNLQLALDNAHRDVTAGPADDVPLSDALSASTARTR